MKLVGKPAGTKISPNTYFTVGHKKSRVRRPNEEGGGLND